MKAYIRCDEDGLVDKVIIKPANENETNFADVMSDGLQEGCEFIADKGYTSKENSDMLERKGLIDAVLYKGARGRPIFRYQLRS